MGKAPRILSSLRKRVVQRLDRVGRIDHLPDLRGVIEEDRQPLPIRPPTRADGGILRIPALRETLQGLLGLGQCRRGIDGSQVRGHCLALLPGNVLQRVAQLVHDAQLHLGPREDRLDRLGQPLEPIHAGDKAVLTPRFFSSLNTVSQNFEPSVWATHNPSSSFSPSRLMPSAR